MPYFNQAFLSDRHKKWAFFKAVSLYSCMGKPLLGPSEEKGYYWDLEKWPMTIQT